MDSDGWPIIVSRVSDGYNLIKSVSCLVSSMYNFITLKSYFVTLMVILLHNIRCITLVSKVTSVILVVFSKYCYITSLPQNVILLRNALLM